MGGANVKRTKARLLDKWGLVENLRDREWRVRGRSGCQADRSAPTGQMGPGRKTCEIEGEGPGCGTYWSNLLDKWSLVEKPAKSRVEGPV